MNLIAGKIQKADKYIKRNFTGNDLEVASEVDKTLKWLPAFIFFLTKKKVQPQIKSKYF
jgi:hypothetical protein